MESSVMTYRNKLNNVGDSKLWQFDMEAALTFIVYT